MKSYRVIIRPQTAFATPLVGDTLFGQICWAIVELFGESRLEHCLEGYLNDAPFMVVSNAFIMDHLLLPTIPSFYWNNTKNVDRKVLKGKQWVDEQTLLNSASVDWQQEAKSNSDIAQAWLTAEQKLLGMAPKKLQEIATQMHNTLNRQSGSTGTGQFAPYESSLTWFHPDLTWQIYILLREDALSESELQQVLTHVGTMGYGRDASIGLGKFHILSIEQRELPQTSGDHNAYMTLANSCVQGSFFINNRSFYLTHTRFGRHGNLMATSGVPFKKPILMAGASGVFAPEHYESRQFIGQGVSGISIDQRTVHQGYAPVIGVEIDYSRFDKA